MLVDAYSWAVLAGALLSGAATIVTLAVAGRAWIKHSNPIDLACAIGAAGWLVCLLAGNTGIAGITGNPWTVFITLAGYQIALVGVSFFLLIGASVTRFKVHALWMTQCMAGLLLLFWNRWASPDTELTYRLWVALNLVCASALSLYLGLNVYRKRSYRGWLVLGGSLLGLGICFEDLLGSALLRQGTFLTHYFYAAFLLMVWLLLSNRVGRTELAAVQKTGQPHSTWENVTGFTPPTDFSALAVTHERRRIAHDLHDGVGSQIINILAMLDTRLPEQQVVALALEQCLLELKVMVDSIDSFDGSVIDALGRLRYRVQHALDRQGIRMVWLVDVDGPLEDFCGERAQQVFRIAQECLANVMRHAHASVVRVTCRHEPNGDFLKLEVRDNGCGIIRQKDSLAVGKGFASLKRRADLLGGKLKISTKVEQGTCILLLVPLNKPERGKADQSASRAATVSRY